MPVASADNRAVGALFRIGLQSLPNAPKYEKGPEFLRIPFAERTGLEPVASGVTDQRSNQLSYRSKAVLSMGDTGFGPVTLCL